MGDSGYKGISADQDSRFKNKDAALLKSIKFPTSFDKKVDMKKVEISVMKPWVAKRVTELLGFEDDVVLEYVAGMLEEERLPDPKKMQISLTGFLESQTPVFMSELWDLLLSAQVSPGGIPAIFVQQKKLEMQKRREEEQNLLREVRRKEEIKSWNPNSGEVSGFGSGGGGSSRNRRSRWDRGQPDIRLDERDGGRGQPSRNQDRFRRNQDSFKDKNGKVTERIHDSGWGSKRSQVDVHGRYPRENSPPSKRSRDDDERGETDDSYRYRRQEYYRNQSPPPLRHRDDSKERQSDRDRNRRILDKDVRGGTGNSSHRDDRERDYHGSSVVRRERRLRDRRSPVSDRSITPDYSRRDPRREHGKDRNDDRYDSKHSSKYRRDEQRGGDDRDETTSHQNDDGDKTPEYPKRDREQVKTPEYQPNPKRSSPSSKGKDKTKSSKWQDNNQDENRPAQSQKNSMEKEKELRDKLLGAKKTQA